MYELDSYGDDSGPSAGELYDQVALNRFQTSYLEGKAFLGHYRRRVCAGVASVAAVVALTAYAERFFTSSSETASNHGVIFTTNKTVDQLQNGERGCVPSDAVTAFGETDVYINGKAHVGKPGEFSDTPIEVRRTYEKAFTVVSATDIPNATGFSADSIRVFSVQKGSTVCNFYKPTPGLY